MRRPFFLIFINVSILLVLVAMLTKSLFVVQRVAVTEDLRGHVDVQRGGRGTFRPLAKNGLVQTNDVVRSAQDGAAEFRWPDGTRMAITPGTQITIKRVTFDSAARADSSEFKIAAGKIFVRLTKALAHGSRFEVETPTAVASVRGTIFSVEVKNEKTRIAVYKGEVKVASGDEKPRAIAPGEVAVSAASGDLVTRADASQNAVFQAQKNIVTPELEARAVASRDPKTYLVIGQSEVGDTVTIDGKEARVLANGVFRLPLPAKGSYVVKTTDKHGATKTVTATFQAPEEKATPKV